MKKVSLLSMLFAAVLFCGNAFAQGFSYNFNDCTAGDKVAATLGEPWTTWSNAPGGAEDGVFAEIGGSMAAHLAYGNDQVLKLGGLEAGVYSVEFDMYVPEGKNGYFNILHNFNGGGSTWAMQCYLHMTNDGQNSTQAPGHGTLHAGGSAVADIPCVYDEWMNFRILVDMDNDVATLYYNDTEIYSWQWSLDSFGENTVGRKLDAVNFFPPENAATSEYYVDNVSLTSETGSQVLIEESFEAYTVGNKIAAEANAAGNDWWTTWSNAPGSAEDGVVSDAEASAGTKSGYISYGNDQVLKLGGHEAGTFELEFDIYVPEGKNGYFNILHNFNGGGSTWAMQCYLHMTSDGQTATAAPGHGTLHAGGNSVADIPCVYDEWMHFRIFVDTDNDEATLYYYDTEIHTWQWSLDSFGENTVGRKLDAVNFFPPQDASSQYYVDNIIFTKVGGASAASLSFDPEEIEVYLDENDVTSVDINIENSGNSIGDWTAWIDFGEGTASSTQQVINYDADPSEMTSLVGLNTEAPVILEVGAMYPAASYGGSVMGTEITKIKYFLGEGQSGNGLQPGTPLTFRIYGQGLNGQPGEVLAEKVLPAANIVAEWNEVTFDTPVRLSGFNVWATVEFTQAVGGYPMNFDGQPVVPYGDMYRTNGGGAFNQCSQNFSEAYGNFHIRITCQGTPVSGSWASLSKPEGTMTAGNSDMVSVNLNSIAIAPGSTMEAEVIFKTNDPQNNTVIIPLTLSVGTAAVAENTTSAYSIYPNPTSSVVTLEGENMNYVSIYNALGQFVSVVKLNGVNNTIDMSGMNSGVYFFNIVDNAGNSTIQRVVVK